jgi:hypothetical protein
MRRREFITILGGAITACPLRTALAADYKPEFKMSIVGPTRRPLGVVRRRDSLMLLNIGRRAASRSRTTSTASFLQANKRQSSHTCNRV